MLNPRFSEKDLAGRATEALRGLLSEIPGVTITHTAIQSNGSDHRVALTLLVQVDDRPYVLLSEIKANGQPRFVRDAIFHLDRAVGHADRQAVPIVIAPYLSEEAQALCKQNRVGFLDLEGNARIAFGTVFIERLVAGKKPPAIRRQLKSVFQPKSARILRVLLREPRRAWRVAELANAAAVSLGHASNVRTKLLEREWVRIDPEGLRLANPDALLDAWRDAYAQAGDLRQLLYTRLHGATFDAAARPVLGTRDGAPKAVLASFSAARWLAPYARTASHYFYADAAGFEQLRHALELAPAHKGENVVVLLPPDDGVFRDAIEPAPGIVCTSAVQTYLDLAAAGERGREAAEHLRRELLAWH